MWTLMKRMALSIAIVLVATPYLAIANEGQPQQRPNFLVITCEDMSPNLGCYGDTYAKTPHLDALAAKGVRYSAAFANGPICSPARTALLFSMYQTSLGAGNHRSQATTPPDLLGFAVHLRRAGYFTANKRKVDYNTPTAWDIEHATYAHNRDWRAEERKGRPFLSIINLDVTHQSRTSVWPYEQFVKQVQSQLKPEEIHDPAKAIVPPYFPDTPGVRKELARYADCITLMDRQAGELLERLAADGLTDDTIVLFFSDHGAGHPRHKSTPFSSGLRVPLIVYCPPRFQHLLRAPVGGVCDDVVMFSDIGPTLLNMAGVDVPEYMHGVPFMGPGVEPREFAYGALDRREHSYNHVRTVSDGRFVYIRNYMPHIPLGQPKGYGWPSEIYQALWRQHRAGELTGAALAYMSSPQPAEMLFDLKTDPYETKNLASESAHADTLARFRKAHQQQIREFADLGLVPEYELDARAADRPWIVLAKQPQLLPLAEIHAAADLVGRGAAVLNQQLGLMKHADSAVRWWALVGLRDQATYEARVTAAVEAALRDPAPLVRVEAADELLERNANHPAARELLLNAISHESGHLAMYAARCAQLRRLNNDTFYAAIQALAKKLEHHRVKSLLSAVERQRQGKE